MPEPTKSKILVPFHCLGGGGGGGGEGSKTTLLFPDNLPGSMKAATGMMSDVDADVSITVSRSSTEPEEASDMIVCMLIDGNVSNFAMIPVDEDIYVLVCAMSGYLTKPEESEFKIFGYTLADGVGDDITVDCMPDYTGAYDIDAELGYLETSRINIPSDVVSMYDGVTFMIDEDSK